MAPVTRSVSASSAAPSRHLTKHRRRISEVHIYGLQEVGISNGREVVYSIPKPQGVILIQTEHVSPEQCGYPSSYSGG